MTAGIAGTTGSGDPLPLIRPPEGGRISLMLLLRNVKSGPLGAACKKSRSNPHRGTLVTVLGGARNLRLQALVATRGLRENLPRQRHEAPEVPEWLAGRLFVRAVFDGGEYA